MSVKSRDSDQETRVGRVAATHEEPLVRGRHAQSGLEHLYNISNLLTRFETLDEVLSVVMAQIARGISLQSAACVLEHDGVVKTFSWVAQPESAELSGAAEREARKAYLEIQHARVASVSTSVELSSSEHAASLPLVIDHGTAFGVVRVQGVSALLNLDLMFLQAAVNQVAVAVDRHVADRAMRASEARLAGIVSLATDAIVSVDEDQQITMFKDGAEKIFGWSRAEAIGQRLDTRTTRPIRAMRRYYS